MVTLEGIVLWNNQPDREAFGLVRKGVGQSTVLRAVETPYPKVNPIQSKYPSWFLSSFTMFHIDDDRMKEFIRLRALVRGLMHM